MAKSNSKNTQTMAAQKTRESSTGWMIKMLSMHFDNEMKKQLKPLGLTVDHFKIMMTLIEKDALTQVQIGNKILMPGYSLSRNLDKLESGGYLKRTEHLSSRRSHSICVTDRGRKLAPKLYAVVKSVNQELLYLLDESEAKQFNQILKKLIAR